MKYERTLNNCICTSLTFWHAIGLAVLNMAAAVEIIKSIKEEIKLATESLPAVRYNSRMLQFLCQQLGKVKDALLNPAMSMTEKALGDLKDAVEQGSHLVRRHAEVFKVENFYKIKDVRHMVQMTCEKLATCFDHLRMQQQVDVQVSMSEDIVQDDRNYMYWYLTCILEGKRVDRQLPDRLKMELEMQISDHRCYMKYVNWIEERKLEKRGRIGAGCQPYGGISHHEQLLKGKKKKKGHGPCLLPNDCPKRLADLLGECISVDSRERPTMAKVDSNLQKILEEVGASCPGGFQYAALRFEIPVASPVQTEEIVAYISCWE
eukprot:evm.model.scf_245.8 EVM.evm.TU.scf_245.8   scf_245:65500-67922(+)